MYIWLTLGCLMVFLLSAATSCFGQAPNVAISDRSAYIVFDLTEYTDARFDFETLTLTVTNTTSDGTTREMQLDSLAYEWPDENTLTIHTRTSQYADYFEMHTDTGAAYWRYNGRTRGFIQRAAKLD